MNTYQNQQAKNQQSMSVAMSPRPGGPQQMQQAPQQQQGQPGPPGIGMGRGISSTGLQHSAIPLNPNHQPGPNPSLQSMQDDMGGQEGGPVGQLDIYIYDYLRRSGFYQAARGLMNEARLFSKDSSPNQDNDSHLPQRRAANLKRSHSGIDNQSNSSPNDKANGKSPGSGSNSPRNDPSDLPEANLPKSGDQGLLKGWWSVFWDIYAARNGYGASTHAYSFLEAMVSIPRLLGNPWANCSSSGIKVGLPKYRDNSILEFLNGRK